jgi:salicylate hydroxylase
MGASLISPHDFAFDLCDKTAMRDRPILISGAGIAGLAAAIALAPKGHAVQVVERATAFSAIGAGLQIGPNAVRALKKLGAWHAVEPVTYSPPEIHVRDGTTGKMLQRIDLTKFEARYGAPYRVAHRADVHAALLTVAQSLNNITVNLGAELLSFGIESDASVTIETAGRHFHGQYLIAADGQQSAIRATLFSAFVAQALPFTIHRTLLDTWPRAGNIAMDCVNLWLCPGTHIVHYPVTGNRLNIVAVAANAGMELPIAKIPALADILSPHNKWTTWPVFRTPSLPAWHHGPVCLIGDAAHGTVPFLAQGAAMALEDAVTLADTMNDPDPFSRFELLRKHRTTRLDQQSRRMAQIYHGKGAMALARNIVMRIMPASLAFAGIDWIYATV